MELLECALQTPNYASGHTPRMDCGLSALLSNFHLVRALLSFLDAPTLASVRAVSVAAHKAVSPFLGLEDEEAFTALRLLVRMKARPTTCTIGSVVGASRSSPPLVRLLSCGPELMLALRTDGAFFACASDQLGSGLPRTHIVLGTPALQRLVPAGDGPGHAASAAVGARERAAPGHVGKKRRTADIADAYAPYASLRVAIADDARLFVPCETLHAVFRYDLPGLQRLAEQQSAAAAAVLTDTGSTASASRLFLPSGSSTQAGSAGMAAAVVAPAASFPLPLFARRCSVSGTAFRVACMRIVDPDLLVLLECDCAIRLLVYDAYTAVLRAASHELPLTVSSAVAHGSHTRLRLPDVCVAGMVASDSGLAFVASSVGCVWAFDVQGVVAAAASGASAASWSTFEAGEGSAADAAESCSGASSHGLGVPSSYAKEGAGSAVAPIPVCLLARPTADGAAVEVADGPSWCSTASTSCSGSDRCEFLAAPGWRPCPFIPVARLPPRYAADGSGSSSAASARSALAASSGGTAGHAPMGVGGRTVMALLWKDDVGRADGQPSRATSLRLLRQRLDSSGDSHVHDTTAEAAGASHELSCDISPDMPAAVAAVAAEAAAGSDCTGSGSEAQTAPSRLLQPATGSLSTETAAPAPLLLVTAEAVFEVPPWANVGRLHVDSAASAARLLQAAAGAAQSVGACAGTTHAALRASATGVAIGGAGTATTGSSTSGCPAASVAAGSHGGAPRSRSRLLHLVASSAGSSTGTSAGTTGSVAPSPAASGTGPPPGSDPLAAAASAAPALGATGAQLMGRHLLAMWSPRDVVLFELQRRKASAAQAVSAAAASGSAGGRGSDSASAGSGSSSSSEPEAAAHRGERQSQPHQPVVRRYGEIWSGQRAGAVFPSSLVSTVLAETPMRRCRPAVLVALASGELMRVS